jgi:hypothetical protein
MCVTVHKRQLCLISNNAIMLHRVYCAPGLDTGC